MSKLLSGADFDLFLLSEAVVRTDVTWQIDGRINEAFLKAESGQDAAPAQTQQDGSESTGKSSYICWQDIRGRIRDLIRGKTAPESLRFQLILDMDTDITGPAAAIKTALPDGYTYIMRIDFDGTDLRIMTSAESAAAGVFDPAGRKEASRQWDTAALHLMNILGIDSEQL